MNFDVAVLKDNVLLFWAEKLGDDYLYLAETDKTGFGKGGLGFRKRGP